MERGPWGGRTVGVLASRAENGWAAKAFATLPEAAMADGSWWCAVVPTEFISIAAWGSRIVSGEGDGADADPRTAAPTTAAAGW